mgnify:CR=1 FL=1
MIAAEIADRLHGRRMGSGWMARCLGPLHAHGDRHPSLSIREGHSGKTLIRCWAGCPTEDVLAARGLRLSDLFVAEPQ